MIFDEPLPFVEAVQAIADKNLLPTELDSAGIRALDVGLRAQSFVSAQTTDEYLLQLYQDKISGMLNPVKVEGQATTGYSPAYVRQAIKQFLAEVGYAPNPDAAGTITDLSSDQRINLVLQTNKQLAQGQGWWLQGQNAAVLDQWPAQELFRAEARAKQRDWLARWRLAGDQTGDPIGTGWTITPDLRLIALKNHDIWNWIGSSELFDDALDVIWPPFAFSSGMEVRDVDHDAAVGLGLMKEGDAAPEPQDVVGALQKFTSKLSAMAGMANA
jgi:hypothetical protein